MLKNGQTYFKNLAVWTAQDFKSIFGHFSVTYVCSFFDIVHERIKHTIIVELSEVYPEPCQTSTMELLGKIIEVKCFRKKLHLRYLTWHFWLWMISMTQHSNIQSQTLHLFHSKTSVYGMIRYHRIAISSFSIFLDRYQEIKQNLTGQKNLCAHTFWLVLKLYFWKGDWVLGSVLTHFDFLKSSVIRLATYEGICRSDIKCRFNCGESNLSLRARSLVVSDLRWDTKGSWFESGCQLCADSHGN